MKKQPSGGAIRRRLLIGWHRKGREVIRRILDIFGLFRGGKASGAPPEGFCDVVDKFLMPGWTASSEMRGETRKIVFSYHGPNDCAVGFVEEVPGSLSAAALDEKIQAVRERMLWAQKLLEAESERRAWLLREESPPVKILDGP